MGILAVDQGTSATKAIVWDDGVRAEVDVPVAGTTYDDDAVEQDPEALLASVLDAGRQAAERAAGVAIDAIGLGNQGETVLAWDRQTGEALTTAVSWQDRRAASVSEAIDEATAARLLAITGLPVDPYFAAPKLAWVREHLLTAAQRDDANIVVTTIDAWTTFRLTGAFVTDPSTASRVQAMDARTMRWSAEACAAYGLDPDRLPRIAACDETVGTTRAFTGAEVPVTALMVDQQAALFGQGCTEAGTAKCTYGTGAFLLANIGDELRISRSGLATSVAWAMRDGTRRYCVDGQVYTAGAALSWLVRAGFLAAPEDLDAACASVEGTAGVTFVPTFAGAGAPTWDPHAKASIEGLSLATTGAHVVRAFAEGLAREIALLADAVAADLGRPLTSLAVDGGLTNSRFLMQAQADALGAPVRIAPFACATALGIAAMARRGALGPGAEDAIIRGWEPERVHEPR